MLKSFLKFTIVLSIGLFFACTGFAALTSSSLYHIQDQALSVRIAEIDRVFTIDEDPNFPGPAASRKMPSGEYVMKKNPKILNTLSLSAQKFIFYHELGHYYLGHLEVPYLQDARYRQRVELEADAFAAYLYKRLHPIDQDILDFINQESRRETWPTGRERAELLLSILGPKTP